MFQIFHLQLTSLPGSQDNTDTLIFYFDEPVTSPPSPEVTYSCEKIVDIATGLIGFILKFSYAYHPLTQEGIALYELDVLQTLASGKRGARLAKVSYNPSLVEEVCE